MQQSNKSPLQQEFERSETYRALKQVGGEVMKGLNEAGITQERVQEGIDLAAKGINRAVDALNREFGKPAKTPPPPAQQTPPHVPQAKPPVQRAPQPAPPVQAPPPPVRMEIRRKPSNAKFWITTAVLAYYALNLPLNTWFDLACMALAGVGAFFLSRAIFKGKKYKVPVEEPKPEPEKKPEPKPEPKNKVDTGSPEVDKIIEDGYVYLAQLREANDRIPDEVMSARIARMEVASAEIFAYITDHPEKAAQIRRFMNYYLPTTLKLLNSYDTLSRQRVKGENIRSTMFEIEGMMETIAGAFETQLDSLFGEDAMDIAADIRVMESILHQEGLSGAAAPKTQAKGGAAVQAESSAPNLTFDPDSDEEA